jgi:ATP-dependent helicase/DNAse subunit B
MDQYSKAPPYLQEIGEIKRYIEPPHHSKFTFLDSKTNILLTGEADGIFELKDQSLAIVDYKTARYTNNQDEMLRAQEIRRTF